MNATSGFPAIRLSDGRDDPAEAHKHMLKELAGRLDQHHVFANGQFVEGTTPSSPFARTHQPLGPLIRRSAPPSPKVRRGSQWRSCAPFTHSGKGGDEGTAQLPPGANLLL
jgi:hypothetical protein